MQSGIVIVLNQYLSRDWSDELVGSFHVEDRVQAYIVLRDRQDIGADASLWDKQSNTMGVVLVEGVVKSATFMQECMQMPPARGEKVIDCVPDALLFRGFKEKTFKCISVLECSEKAPLLRCMLKLCKYLHGMRTGNRFLVRHAGRAVGVLERWCNHFTRVEPLAYLNDDADDDVDSDDDVVDSALGLRSFLDIPLPQILVRDYLKGFSVDDPWESVSAWVVGMSEAKSLLECRPGCVTVDLPSHHILLMCRTLLRECLLEAMMKGPVRAVVGASLHVVKRKQSSRARKLASNRSTLIMNLSYDRDFELPDGLKHSLVWVVPGSKLQEAVNRGEGDLFQFGWLHLLVGHSPDMRRVYVEPLVERIPSPFLTVATDVRLMAEEDVSDASEYICERCCLLFRKTFSNDERSLKINVNHYESLQIY